MSKILRIDASSRLNNSYSRELADVYIKKRIAKYPGDEVIVRDLVKEPVTHISEGTITGFYTPVDQFNEQLRADTALSDLLIEELQSADILVISSPIYNFSVPSALKAYIDQIVRINRTFSYDGTSFAGMLKPGKRAYLFCAYGGAGYSEGGPFASANFLEPYLKFVLQFLGVSEIQAVSVEATTADEATVRENMVVAKKSIDELSS